MKKILSIAAVALLAGSAWGHVPIPGIDSATLFQWPAGQEPTLDGDLSGLSDERVVPHLDVRAGPMTIGPRLRRAAAPSAPSPSRRRSAAPAIEPTPRPCSTIRSTRSAW